MVPLSCQRGARDLGVPARRLTACFLSQISSKSMLYTTRSLIPPKLAPILQK